MDPRVDGDTSLADDDAPSEVAAALAEGDDSLADAVESTLGGRSGVVAVGVPLTLLPSILSARDRSSGEPWRVTCRPGVVDTLGRAFVLGTAVAEAVRNDEIVLRTAGGNDRTRDRVGGGWTADRTLFATPNRVDAVAGPDGDWALVTGSDSAGSAAGAARVATDRFEAATPATVDMPPRSRLLAAARELLDDRFAGDVAAVLESLAYGEIGRIGDVTDQTLLVALAARHDHLFRDLRGWVGTGNDADETGDEQMNQSNGVGIAPGQELTADRRALVDRNLIESIKVPMGPGRPKLRLRAVDDALLRANPEEVPSILRGRFAVPLDEDGTLRGGRGHEGRRPVWQRDR